MDQQVQPWQPQQAQKSCSIHDYNRGYEANPTTSGATIHNAVPYPGETFIIIHKASGRPITLLEDGSLQLDKHRVYFACCSPALGRASAASSRSSIHWLCVERNGWLGFRSVRNGKYIGQSIRPNSRMDIEVTSPHHKAWEYFCARRHPQGGYLLQSPIEDSSGKIEPWLCTLWKMEVCWSGSDRAGGKLVLREDGGALWEFVRVEGTR
ncbi:hypothetical protein V8F20_006154 [Naviculisporaceae sp. PSN 640]